MTNSISTREMEDAKRLAAQVGQPLVRAFRLASVNGYFLSVLRNYESLPDMPGRDIDIFVDEAELSRVAEIFRQCFIETGWMIISDWTRSHVRSISMVKRIETDVAGFTVDLLARVKWRGIDIAHPRAIHEVTVLNPTDRFAHVSPGADAALRLQKVLLRGEAESLAKMDMIRNMALSDENGFNRVMSDMMNSGDLRSLHSAFFGGGEINTLMSAFKKMQSRLVRKNLMSRPWLLVIWVRLALSLIIVPRSRKGKTIVFVGPDGSGKSTMINRTTTLLKNHGPRKTKRYYGRVPIFPRLSTFKLLLKPNVEKPDFTAKHSGSRLKPHSHKRMACYLLYYGLEGGLARIVLFYQKMRGRVVLFDRFAYDFAVQPAYAKLPRPWLNALLSVLPKPDIVCFLYCDPAVIYARKPELRVEDIADQQLRYQYLFATFGEKPVIFNLNTTDFERDDFIHFISAVSADWGATTMPSLTLSVADRDAKDVS